MRLVSSATWASGDPVSVPCRPYSPRMVFFCSAVSATNQLHQSVRELGPKARISVATANCSTRRVGRESSSASARGKNRAGVLGIFAHGRDQVLDPVELLLTADAGDEIDRDMLAVQVRAGVQDERLYGARAARKRRVGANRNRGLITLAGHHAAGDRAVPQHGEPRGVDTVGR